MIKPSGVGGRLASLAVACALTVAACGGSHATASAPVTTGAPAPTSSSAPTPPTTAPPAPTDTTWLCRPGANPDPCVRDLTTTAVAANGAVSLTAASANPAAPVDCFYVYPAVSTQPGFNADLTIEPQETGAASTQAAQFSQLCRVYAPMYRQVTLAGTAQKRAGQDAWDLAYAGVRDAWRDYAAHHNGGRGVVLLGDSEGGVLLGRLVSEVIDPDPTQRRLLVSAILPGADLTAGMDGTGTFPHVPPCGTQAQTGCFLSWSSFDQTPAPDTSFGRSHVAGREIVCVNPSALAGGPAPIHPIFPLGLLHGLVPPAFKAHPTAWVTYPGLYRATCRNQGDLSWLQVDDVRGTSDSRPTFTDLLGPHTGLHVLDVAVVLGDLVTLVRTQASAWHLSA